MPWSTIVRNGAPTITFGSVDVTHWNAPICTPQPIVLSRVSRSAVTTGINSYGDQVNPGQHLTRVEALRLFTRDNSWFLRMEDKIGSLETGKLADLAVLDRDYFAVPDAEIKKIRSVLTMVDGKVVHNAGIV